MNQKDLNADCIRVARQLYTDNVEVDDSAQLSIGVDGIWVQAWVWLDNGTLKANGIDNPEAA